MRATCRVALALLACRAFAEEVVDFRTDMEGEVVFKNTGVSDVSMAMLTETMGIVCYNDWQNPEQGQCNALDFSNGATPEAGPEVVLTDVKTQRFSVSRFSDTMGVVCYSSPQPADVLQRWPPPPNHSRPACHTLSLSGGSGTGPTLSTGEGFDFDPFGTYPYNLDVVGLTDTTGVLCYQVDDVLWSRRDLFCMVLKVESETLSSAATTVAIDDPRLKTWPNPVAYDNIVATAMAKVSDTEVVVCYVDGTRHVALCNRMRLTESGEELSIGSAFVLREALSGASPGSLSVVALSDSRGVACYCDGGHGPSCAPLDFSDGMQVSSAGDLLTVGDVSCSEVSMVAMSETGAIACYLAGTGQVGTCSGLVLNHGSDLTMGDPTEIPATSGASTNDFVPPSECVFQNCDQWISLSAQHGANAVACYGGVGGSETGRCIGLSIPPPTSTSTATTVTETSSTTEHTTTETSTTTKTQTSTLTSVTTTTETSVSTTTETSSTTEHTTTETSTTTKIQTSTLTSVTTATETSVSTTTETSSTTPHTTTVTTVTDVTELSGAPAQAAAGCAAAAVAVASMLF